MESGITTCTTRCAGALPGRSSIFNQARIAVFFVTAATFSCMSLYGYTTKRDLTSIGNLCFMALIGLIIASIVNMFMQSSGLHWLLTYVGVLIFVGLTAYDTQKIKKMGEMMDGSEDADLVKKASIMGALNLYLDFILLFIYLLRILGSRR